MKWIKKTEIKMDQLEKVTGGLGYETGPLGTELTGIRVKATGPLDENIDYPYMSRLGVRV